MTSVTRPSGRSSYILPFLQVPLAANAWTQNTMHTHELPSPALVACLQQHNVFKTHDQITLMCKLAWLRFNTGAVLVACSRCSPFGGAKVADGVLGIAKEDFPAVDGRKDLLVYFDEWPSGRC